VRAGGESIETSAGALEVLWTPGHSPGHVCLYDRSRRFLFSGDHMLEHISPNIGWQPDHDALADFLESLERISRLEIERVLPSHGAPFSGHQDWIRATREHHAVRCARILQLAAGEPLTAAELVDRIWEGLSSPFHYRFAVFEVLAHLEYMERRNDLVRRNGAGPDRWQAATRP
jgi:glyoxylase-like metal-dependent hydrolase (beta-lactamase superfamily II)